MNKNFCIMPFIHMNFKPGGLVTPCWRSMEALGKLDQPIADIWTSEAANNIRQQFLNGERPERCNSCWDIEDNSDQDSTRKICNKTYKQYISDILNPIPKSIEVRFSNLCNYRCLHCDAAYSSKWAQLIERQPELIQYNKSMPCNDDILNEDKVDEIINFAISTVEEILIAGGEPLVQPLHYKFLDKIKPEHAKNITLSYSTNLSVLNFEKYDILTLWDKFKKVVVKISIDGEPNMYSYLRSGGDIKNIEQNIIKLQTRSNIKILGTCTTSILNVTRLDKIVEYFEYLGVQFHSSLVQYPTHLNIQNLPMILKAQIVSKIREMNMDNRSLKHTTDIIGYMMSVKQDEKQWTLFKEYITVMDKVNNTSFLETYPEFMLHW